MARVAAQGDTRPMAQSREAMADLRRILAGRAAFYAKADADLRHHRPQRGGELRRVCCRWSASCSAAADAASAAQHRPAVCRKLHDSLDGHAEYAL